MKKLKPCLSGWRKISLMLKLETNDKISSNSWFLRDLNLLKASSIYSSWRIYSYNTISLFAVKYQICFRIWKIPLLQKLMADDKISSNPRLLLDFQQLKVF